MTNRHRYSQAKKVTLLGAFFNAALGIIKLLGGFLFHSHALVADGVHSLSDLLTDIMVLIASKYGSFDADDSHPYGHQRIETAATLLLALLLILAGFSIAWDSLYDLLISHNYTSPNWLSLLIICSSILINEALFHYTLHIGKCINSKLIIANAWHHRSDAASSLVVFVGLIGSIMGFIYFDSIAAIIVGLMIIKMGGDYAWNSVRELVDTAVSPQLLEHIKQVIERVDGVKKIHQLRTRSMGDSILIDVHVLVSPYISVSEGHYIAQHVDHALLDQIEQVNDVIVHIDPEDDERCSPSLYLPSRKIVQEQLLNKILIHFPQIIFWNLHYLNGSIKIDIVCNEKFNEWDELHHQVMLALKLQPEIVHVRLFSLHEIMHHN